MLRVEEKSKQAGFYYDSSLILNGEERGFAFKSPRFIQSLFLSPSQCLVNDNFFCEKSHSALECFIEFISSNQIWISGSYEAVSSHKEFKSCLFRLIAHDISYNHVLGVCILWLPLHVFRRTHKDTSLKVSTKSVMAYWKGLFVALVGLNYKMTLLENFNKQMMCDHNISQTSVSFQMNHMTQFWNTWRVWLPHIEANSVPSLIIASCWENNRQWITLLLMTIISRKLELLDSSCSLFGLTT